MADITEAIRRLIFEYVSKGADQVVQTQEAVAASTTKTDKASLSLEKSFGSLERRYVDTVRNQQDYQKVQEKVNAAVAQNPALQERANVVLASAAEHYDKLALNANKGGIATSLLSRAFTTILGPAGLIGIALTAVGATLVYLEEKFQLIPLALNGIAAALASVGFEQAAQKVAEYGERMREVTAAAEAQKAALKEIQAAHPRISTEVAKQVQLQEAQLQVAQARGKEEKIIAQEKADIVQYLQQEMLLTEATTLAAGKRKIAEEGVREAIEGQTNSLLEQKAAEANRERDMRDANQLANEQQTAQINIGSVIQNNVSYQRDFTAAIRESIFWATSLAEAVEGNLDLLDTQFNKQGGYVSDYDPLDIGGIYESMKQRYGAGNVELVDTGAGYAFPRLSQSYIDQQNKAALEAHAAGYDVSSPAAIQKSFENALSTYGSKDMSVLNRLIEVAQPDQQASLIQQAISQVLRSEPAGLAREEMIQTLNDKLEGLTNSTDSLNSTMQNALSPFYSQDPRTTKLGFRAGVTGNPDWMTGATNANPLVAVLGAGATAPGMANGGSFVVGGGYSANDNRMAVFPVASGEEIIVNRNREGRGGQVVNIDNRIVVTGTVDADTLSKMKVSRYQQSQRMRAGLAQA